MLGDISVADEIYVVCGYTDMRKSIDGLCALVQDQLKLDPFSSSLYLFCGKRRDRIKALFWEKDGFVLLYKRLTGTGSYKWPRNQTEVRNLTWKEFSWLLDGLEIDQPKAIKPTSFGGKLFKSPVVLWIKNGLNTLKLLGFLSIINSGIALNMV